MRNLFLVKKGIKKNFGTLFSIMVLLFLIFSSLIVALTINNNSIKYIKEEMDRLGYGNITAWVSNVDSLENIKNEIESIEDVSYIDYQKLIFSGYSINGKHSDNEGQLLEINNNYNYRFFKDDLKEYENNVEIMSGEIYISPSMISSFDVNVGDTITFELSRNGLEKEFIVAGFFEDPFMGSSMIDMKSFLISKEDYLSLEIEINNADDSIARNGAMIHIFKDNESKLSNNEFNMLLNTHTDIQNYTEFVYTNETIFDFMMVLQNIFIGFLIAFVIVLLIVSIIIIAHNISNTIESDKKVFGILKTIGYSNKRLKKIEIIKYSIFILLSMFLSVLLSIFLIPLISHLLITSSGFIMPTNIPIVLCLSLLFVIGLILILLIIIKMTKLSKIKPIEMIDDINDDIYNKEVVGEITKKWLLFSIATRQILTNKTKYIGVFVVSILLTFFCLIVGRLDNWLGKNGEGLMDTFSVAEHDIGLQPFVHVDIEKIQNEIEEYANIVNVYALAMENVNVEGIDYTANILDDSSWFHILKGKAPTKNDEIVITNTVASELGISIGDTVTVAKERIYEEYVVVGIYSCANEMGANIGMNREGYARLGSVNAYIWCYHYILDNHEHNEEIMSLLQKKYPMQMDVHTNSWSGLDGIVASMNLLVIFMYIILAFFILIVVNLVSSKLLLSEKKDMVIYKSLGFTSKLLRISFSIRFLIVAFVGGMVGLLLSLLFADKVILMALRIFGIGDFNSSNYILSSMLPVLLIAIIFAISAYIASRKIKKIKLNSLI